MRSFEVTQTGRQNAKVKIAMSGPSGSGKTTSALRLAYGLCPDWNKIGVIDTENKSSKATIGTYEIEPFKHIDFQPPYDPEAYISAIQKLEREGCEVIIIDSTSHEWIGIGGCLEIHADLTEKDKKPDGRPGDSYAQWKKVTPRHMRFLDEIRYSNYHVISCLRSKQETVRTTDDRGRSKIEKVGLQAQTRDGFEYEMTIAFDIILDGHLAFINTNGKDRTGLFDGKAPRKLTPEDGQAILAWCNSGAEITEEEQRMEVISRINQLKTIYNLANEQLAVITELSNGTANASLDELKNGLLKLNGFVSNNVAA